MKSEETIEEHMGRLGCFSSGEVEALLRVEASHEKVDQLAKNKGVELELAVSPAPAPKTKPEVIPNGMFWCSHCHSLHRIASKTGDRHLKYREEA